MSDTRQSIKYEIRERMRALRQSLTPENVLQASEAVRRHLSSLRLADEAAVVCIYASTGKEIGTLGIMQDLLHRGKSVCVPDWEGWHGGAGLRLLRIDDTAELLTEGRIVPQPGVVDGRQVPVEDVDLFLVPGLAFDSTGTRLGMGGGYFDRLLSGAAPGATLTGLAHDFQFVSRLPQEAHDVPMTLVLYPTRGPAGQVLDIREGISK